MFPQDADRPDVELLPMYNIYTQTSLAAPQRGPHWLQYRVWADGGTISLHLKI